MKSNQYFPPLLRSFVSDLRDSSATSWNSDNAASDVFKIMVPSILAATTSINEFIKLIALTIPVIITRLVPLAAVIACCIFAICSKVQLKQDSPAETRSLIVGGPPYWRYRFSSQVRRAAKWCLPVLAMTLVFNFANTLPNRIAGIKQVAGILCVGDSGSPAAHAVVEVLDDYGQTVSQKSEVTDGRGLFNSRALPWGQAPSVLTIRYGRCPIQRLLIAADTRSACREGAITSNGIPPDARFYSISCQN